MLPLNPNKAPVKSTGPCARSPWWRYTGSQRGGWRHGRAPSCWLYDVISGKNSDMTGHSRIQRKICGSTIELTLNPRVAWCQFCIHPGNEIMLSIHQRVLLYSTLTGLTKWFLEAAAASGRSSSLLLIPTTLVPLLATFSKIWEWLSLAKQIRKWWSHLKKLSYESPVGGITINCCRGSNFCGTELKPKAIAARACSEKNYEKKKTYLEIFGYLGHLEATR